MNFTNWYSCLKSRLQISQAIFIDPIACLMTLYTERWKAHLIVATDCSVSIIACSMSKDANFGKCWATELHSIAAQKFLSEFTGLSARNVDHGVCVIKLHAFGRCKRPKELLVVANKSDLFSWHHWFRPTGILPCKSSFSVVRCDFYGRLHSRRDAKLFHVCLSACIIAAFIGEFSM
jgi:hypothetical protein